MRLRAIDVPTLPKLAWCARVRRGDDTVVLWHGPWVEVRTDAFVEGAWDGPFPDFAFDDARTLTGSGGRSTPDGFLFAASSYVIERLFSIHAGDALFVSNSFVFVMVAAGRAPAPDYPYYYPDWAALTRLGITPKPKYLPLDQGVVRFHDAENFVVKPDLSIERRNKRDYASPESFTGYRQVMVALMRALFENAAAPARRVRYTPLATLSQGYDGNTVAVLAMEGGCRAAMTLRNRKRADPEEDSGLEIGRRLGLDVGVYDFYEFHRRPGSAVAEFRATPRGADPCLLAAEANLPGRILLTGRFGDVIWSFKKSVLFKDYFYPGSQSAGSSMLEFRLRVGFLGLPVPYCAGRDPQAFYRRITRSPDMAPWIIGHGYDRPFARRVLEEAGVPREWFGQRKLAGAHIVERVDQLGDAAHRDYLDFVRSQPARPPRRGGAGSAPLRWLARVSDQVSTRVEEGLATLDVVTRLPTRLPLRYRMPPSPHPLAMQHGFARTRSRYDGVVTASAGA